MPGGLLLVKPMFIIIAIMNANDQKVPIRDIDTALLRAFVAVAESGSMTIAANRLNVTQGAVSQRIKRLEGLLQKPLFDRSGQGLESTIEGERLIVPAQKLIALNDEVFALMTAPEFTGTVRFGVPYDIIFPFVGPILKSFASAYPKVSVELEVGTSEDLKTALARGGIDLTLTTENHTPKGAERLIHNELVWVGGRGGESYLQTPLPLVLVNENCMFRMPMLRALEHAGRAWRINVTRNMDASFAMLSADLGVTAILDSTVPSYVDVLDAGQGLPDLPVFYINLYTSASGANEIASELAQHIRDQFAQWRKPPVLFTA